MRLSSTTTILSIKDPTPPQERLLVEMHLLKKAGFVHQDLNLGTQGQEGYPLAMDGWEAWVDRVRLESCRLGVDFHQAHSFYYRTKESTSNSINRPWYEERIRRSICAARRLGVKWLVLHPCDFDRDPVYDFAKARRFNLDYWRPFVEMAAKEEVGIAFENLFQSGHHQRYCSIAEELADLVDAFDNPYAGICWDTGHAYVAGQDQDAAIRMLGKRIKATHIHDNHGQPKGDEHLMPYYGTLNWNDILKALSEIDYEGNFSFELKHATQPLPPSLCEDMLRFLYGLGMKMIGKIEEYRKGKMAI